MEINSEHSSAKLDKGFDDLEDSLFFKLKVPTPYEGDINFTAGN